jgi:hypothetical protein
MTVFSMLVDGTVKLRVVASTVAPLPIQASAQTANEIQKIALRRRPPRNRRQGPAMTKQCRRSGSRTVLIIPMCGGAGSGDVVLMRSRRDDREREDDDGAGGPVVQADALEL